MTTDPDRNFGLLLPAGLDSERLAAALAEAYAVSVIDVDVAPQGLMERKWDAAVLCTFEQATGDIAWILDIYVSEAVTTPPSVERAASILAARLGEPVLYQAEASLMTAYWLATPRGWRTRAQVDDIDDPDQDDLPAIGISSVEQPVSELPRVPVEDQVDVVRSVRPAAPISSEWKSWAATRMSEPIVTGDPVWYASSRLAAWEQLTVRMASGWPPDGWYPLDLYWEDLEIRDQLAIASLALPRVLADRFEATLARIDDAFRAHTRPITPEQLAERFGLPDSPGRGWWWRQMPEPEPWENSPSRRAAHN